MDTRTRLAKQFDQMIDALQLAYRKHSLNDDSIGWCELSIALSTALQESMGDQAFQAWLKEWSNQ